MNNNTNASLINGQLTSGSDIPCSGAAPAAIPDYREKEGVSPNCAQNSAMPIEPEKVWFYMRVAYGQEKKVRDYLISEGIEAFLPTIKKERVLGGIKKEIEASLIPNSLFVHCSADEIKKYIGNPPTEYLHHYYEPFKDNNGKFIGSGRRPIIIPIEQMNAFLIWLNSESSNKLFIETTDFQFKKNDRVLITDGDFKGFIGLIVRLKGQTRVGLTIHGVGFIATAYVPTRILTLV